MAFSWGFIVKTNLKSLTSTAENIFFSENSSILCTNKASGKEVFCIGSFSQDWGKVYVV